MDFSVKFSEQAFDDMDSIINYIGNELHNPQAAERFFNKVNEKIPLLGKNPYMYPLHHDEILRSKGLHFIVIGNYLLFYLIDKNSSVVSIARIVYGGRNLPVIFDEENEQ